MKGLGRWEWMGGVSLYSIIITVNIETKNEHTDVIVTFFFLSKETKIKIKGAPNEGEGLGWVVGGGWCHC